MPNDFYRDNITYVPVNGCNLDMGVNSTSFFIGSCFAENMYNKFNNLYLNTTFAPFGNIYNPKSLGKSLNRLIENKPIKSEDCILCDGIYKHFDFHSTLGNKNINDFINKINNSILSSHTKLLSAQTLIITLGSAYIFEKDGSVVNNCHKIPKDQFIRRALTVEEIKESLIPILKKLKSLNKNINIVFTLSPVRHLRDNPAENSLSKALLRVAIDEINNVIPTHYFPSYEILLDELRDYRWYDSSLNHPSKEAVSYIISRFIESAADDDLKNYIKRVSKLITMMQHKIINSESDSTKLFLNKKEKALLQMKQDYKGLEKLQLVKSSQYL